MILLVVNIIFNYLCVKNIFQQSETICNIYVVNCLPFHYVMAEVQLTALHHVFTISLPMGKWNVNHQLTMWRTPLSETYSNRWNSVEFILLFEDLKRELEMKKPQRQHQLTSVVHLQQLSITVQYTATIRLTVTNTNLYHSPI